MKKAFLGLVALCAIGALLFGRDLFSVAGTALMNTRASAEDFLGLEFQVDRVRKTLQDSNQEMQEQQRLVAELRVSIQELEEEILKLESKEDGHRDQVQRLVELFEQSGNGARDIHLNNGSGDVKSGVEVERALQSQVASLQGVQSALKMRKAVLAEYKSSFSKGLAFVGQQRQRKDELQMALNTADLELDSLKMRESASGLNLEGSGSLAEAASLLNGLGHEIDVRLATLDIRENPYEDLFLEQRANPDVLMNQARLALSGKKVITSTAVTLLE